MPNRSISRLPSYFAPSPESWLPLSRSGPYALDVFDITYLHFHDSMELGVCTSGRGTCVVEGRAYPFREGDAQVIFPFQSHLSQSEGGTYSRWHWMNLDPVRRLGGWGAPNLPRLERLLHTRMGLCGIIDRARYPLICELIWRVVLPGEEARRFACLCALIEELAAESRALPPLALRPSRQFTRLAPAIEMVQNSLEQSGAPAVGALSKACALSPAPFRRAFRMAMGQSPRQYVLSCQMQKAQRLLLCTGESITEIALAVGYQDVSGFNRAFMRAFGVPPSAYRASAGDTAARSQSRLPPP